MYYYSNMPTNKKGGPHFKRHKKQTHPKNPKFITTADGHLQFYASVVKATGNRHFIVKFHRHDGQDLAAFTNDDNMFEKEFLGGLRGNIRKGNWVSTGDLVLVSLRDFSISDNKIDIIKKYTYEESKYLKQRYNIITNNDKANVNEDVTFEYDEVKDKPTPIIKNNKGPYMNELFMPSISEDEDGSNSDDVAPDNNEEDVNTSTVDTNEEDFNFDVDEI
jgi:translation initiation factor IF-1